MKISSILHGLLAHCPDDQAPDMAWIDDPYAHPAIDAMNERERADLPPTHLPPRRAVARPSSWSVCALR